VTNCPRCGGTLLDTDTFCRACGVQVAGEGAKPIPYRLILTIIWMTIASGIAVILVVELKKVILDIVVAGFLALVLNPGVQRLQRFRLNRGQSIAVVVLIATIAIMGIGTLIAAPLASSATKFAASAPTTLQEASQGKGSLGKLVTKLHLQNQLKKASSSLSNTIGKLSGAVLTVGRRVASAAFRTIIVIILAIFMLVEGPRLVDGAKRLVPVRHQEAARRVGQTASRVISGYTTGVLIMAALNGVVAGIAMEITHTPFVLPLATWAAVIDILPIVGGLLAMVPAALFGFTHSIQAGIINVLAIFIYQQIKNHFLYPVVVGRAVSLGSLLVLVSVLAGAELAGIGGAILAIPIAGVLNAIVVEISRYRAAKRAEEIASDVTDEQPPAGPQKQASRIRAAATKMRSRRAARKTPAPPR
jgi:predicted PurR-regulated permease PerM